MKKQSLFSIIALATLASSLLSILGCMSQEARTDRVVSRQDRIDTRTSARQDRRDIRAEREDARAARRFDSW